ncbi:MAG: hypothetical protein GEV09_14320 [Pseudonocardiaceae bacterium]|nr:hypothetical protein [Pseudonocardiaceae bacterium]
MFVPHAVVNEGALKADLFEMSMCAVQRDVEFARARFVERRESSRRVVETEKLNLIEGHGIMPSDARHPNHAGWAKEKQRRDAERACERERARADREQARAERAEVEAERVRREAAERVEVERRKRWTVKIGNLCRGVWGILVRGR